MRRFKKFIEHIFTRKNIKIFLLVVVVLGFFVGSSFAQTSEAASLTPVQKISHLLKILISILSWVWVVLATLAGKLMTNEFVYGTFLHLDRALWQLWNMMKNFANFTLGFILVYTIVKNLFKGSFGDSSGDPIKAAKDTIIHTLIAGVLVQMSWFLMAAMLDLSTIATAAVGALPSQFMASSTSFQNNMKSLITTGSTKRLVIDFSENGDVVDAISTTGVDSEEDLERFFDTIMPNTESMAGTFMFLGASVFDLYDLSDSSKNLSGTDDIGDLILQLGINGFVLLSFSIMLALIFLFNLFRVITLWVVIPLTPFIIVLAVFSKGKNSNSKLSGFLGDIANYEKILKLVFKPVYMTLVLSIVLIVMVLVKALAKANDGNIDMQQNNNMVIESRQDGSIYESSLDVANIATIKMKMGESIVDLFVYILGVVLMFMLMKSCVSGDITGIEFIDKRIKKLSEGIWGKEGEIGGILGSVGVIPVGGGKKVGLKQIKTLGENIGNNRNNIWSRAVGIDIDKQDRAVEDRLGFGSFSSLSPDMDRDDWIKKAVKIGKGKNYANANDMFTRDKGFKKAFDAWNSKTGNTPISVDRDLEPAWKDSTPTPPRQGQGGQQSGGQQGGGQQSGGQQGGGQQGGGQQGGGQQGGGQQGGRQQGGGQQGGGQQGGRQQGGGQQGG